MTQSEMVKMGKAWLVIREARDRLKKLDNAFDAKWPRTGMRSQWWETGVCLQIPLSEYLGYAPDEKPEFKEYESESKGKVMGYMEYPMKAVAEIKPGFWLWVQAETKMTAIRDLPVKLADVAAESGVAA